jgi:hypothetical protein
MLISFKLELLAKTAPALSGYMQDNNIASNVS